MYGAEAAMRTGIRFTPAHNTPFPRSGGLGSANTPSPRGGGLGRGGSRLTLLARIATGALALAFLLSGCAPAPAGGGSPATAPANAVAIDRPLVIFVGVEPSTVATR